MTKTLQEQQDEQGYSVDDNTYFHPASELNGLTINASSPIPALDAMLGKRITNTLPSTIPAKRKSPSDTHKHPQTSAKGKQPLPVHDLNGPMSSVQIQQATSSAPYMDQYAPTSSQKARRVLPHQNPPAQFNNGAQHNRNGSYNSAAQHNSRPTFRSSQPSSSSAGFSMSNAASTPSSSSSSRIIQAPPIEDNWVKKTSDPDLSKTLSQEQLAIYDSVVRLEKSIYLTGTAGTGKSVVLKAIVKGLESKYGADRVAVTASTGLAACHIGGVTIHSEFGIGLGEKTVNYYTKTIKNQVKNYSKINSLRALVIDEISMIEAGLFDKLNLIAQVVRKNMHVPFGGIQVVLCGDFYQLPPIVRGSSNVRYAFEANCWDSVVQETMILTKSFRQTDHHFTNILNELKKGQVSDQTLKELQSLERPLTIHHGIEPTELYPLRKELNAANDGKLRALSGESFMYKSTDSGNTALLNHCLAPGMIELKVNAQVLLIKNMTSTLVNGSRGVISEFKETEDKKLLPVVTFANGEKQLITPYSFTFESHGHIVATRLQIPLILAWALSIHKSQGQTIECLQIDLKSCFDYGQVYVALSRVKSMENLQVFNFSRHIVRANSKVIDFYKKLDSKKQ